MCDHENAIRMLAFGHSIVEMHLIGSCRFREKFKRVARDKHHRDTTYSAVSIPRAEEVEGSEYDVSVMTPMQAEWLYPHQLDLKDVASDTSPIMLYLHGGGALWFVVVGFVVL